MSGILSLLAAPASGPFRYACHALTCLRHRMALHVTTQAPHVRALLRDVATDTLVPRYGILPVAQAPPHAPTSTAIRHAAASCGTRARKSVKIFVVDAQMGAQVGTNRVRQRHHGTAPRTATPQCVGSRTHGDSKRAIERAPGDDVQALVLWRPIHAATHNSILSRAYGQRRQCPHMAVASRGFGPIR